MKRSIKRYRVKLVEFKSYMYGKPGTKTAILRQRITFKTEYNTAEGVKTHESNEYRVAFVTVSETETLQNVRKELAKNHKCCIYKISSNHPILTEKAKTAIKNHLKTMDDYADVQVVRFNLGEYKAKGDLVLDTFGKPQYRYLDFSWTFTEDVDLRNADPNDYYASSVIKLEMESK